MANIVKSEQAAIQYTPEQINLIRSQIAPGATDNELKLFLYQCQRTGLDALSRQIYAIFRSVKEGNNWIKKMSIQTSIDGFRVIAERSGLYAGQSEPEFTEENGKLVLCKVRVFKFHPVTHTRYEAAVGVAYWDEYVPKEGQDMMWKKMPFTMLAKVAEALALRKSFPLVLSGLYTSDEMQQSEDTTAVEITTQEQPANVSQQATELPALSETGLLNLKEQAKKCESIDTLNNLFATKKKTHKIGHAEMAIYNDRKKELTQTVNAN